jgi:ABC-2 type transport system ATP-binding protein
MSSPTARAAAPSARIGGATAGVGREGMQMSTAISLTNVVKTFGPTRALDGLDLEVTTGEVHGYLGPNGAGKSVTIRTLLGLLKQDSGHVRVLGGDPWRDAVELHRRVAYVPGDVSLWPNLSGGEIIDYYSRLRGGVDKAKRDALIERFELDPRKKANTYSKGNRQKVALVTALACDAELFLLDEPTAGLDPLMENLFQDYVVEMAAEGRTVLLSSHILAEVEKLCDRVTIIRQGRVVQHGTLDELRTTTRTSISVSTERPIEGIASVAGVHSVRTDESHVHLDVESTSLDAVLTFLTRFGVRSLVSQPPTLEELFLREYGDQIESDDAEAAR